MPETAFQAAIPNAVGESYDPTTKEYIVVRHAQVGFKCTPDGGSWTVCCEVEDTTPVKGSTMVVMERSK